MGFSILLYLHWLVSSTFIDTWRVDLERVSVLAGSTSRSLYHFRTCRRTVKGFSEGDINSENRWPNELAVVV